MLFFQLIDGAIILFGCLQLQEEQIGKMNFLDILICNDPNDTLLSDSPLYVTGIITLVVCCVFPVLLIGVVLVRIYVMFKIIICHLLLSFTTFFSCC